MGGSMGQPTHKSEFILYIHINYLSGMNLNISLHLHFFFYKERHSIVSSFTIVKK
jgi:hypothetical protein